MKSKSLPRADPLHELKRREEQAASVADLEAVFSAYLQLLQEAPSSIKAWEAFGQFLLYRLEDALQALTVFRKLQSLDCDNPQWILYELDALSRNDWGEVTAVAFSASQRFPEIAEFWNWLGTASRNQGDLARALNAFNKAIGIRADFYQAIYNRGLVFMGQRRYRKALKDFQQTLKIEPSHMMSAQNAAHIALGLGRYSLGWKYWRQRLSRHKECKDAVDYPFKGELRIVGEQGLGDILFYMRFLPEMLRQRSYSRVDLWVPSRIHSVLRELYPEVHLHVIQQDAVFKPYSALADLPCELETATPKEARPIQISVERNNPVPRVGIVWRAGHGAMGTCRPDSANHKEFPLSVLVEALQGLNCRVRVLQRYPTRQEMVLLEHHLSAKVEDASASNEDPKELLEAISACDFVVGVSSTAFHLGLHTDLSGILLATHPPDFRWGLNASHSDWMSGLHVLRQDEDGQWIQASAQLKPQILELFNSFWQSRLSRQPRDGRAWAQCALVQYQRADYEKALQNMKHSVALEPEESTRLKLIEMLLEAHEIELAEQYLEGSFASSMQLFRARSLLATLKGEFAEAREWLTQALKQEPENPTLLDWRIHLEFLNQNLPRAWDVHRFRPGALGNPLGLGKAERPQVTSAAVLLVQEQGLGDELFFLSWVSALREAGASWIGYVCTSKLQALLTDSPALDFVGAAEDVKAAPDLILLIGDLPWVLECPVRPDPFVIEPPLEPLPPSFADPQSRAAVYGLTWESGVRTAHRVSRALHKRIEPSELIPTLMELDATFVLLQRNPDPQDVLEFQRHLGNRVVDWTHANESLTHMVHALQMLDEYICTSNTNLHMFESLGYKARALVPFPPESRWGIQCSSLGLMPSKGYYQSADGSWNQALSELKSDLTP